jgi:hypothetical protein
MAATVVKRRATAWAELAAMFARSRRNVDAREWTC